MSDRSKPKDNWDKAAIVISGAASLALPMVLAIVGVLTNSQLSSIDSRLKASQQDAELMKEFHAIYYSDKSRRFAPLFIQKLSDEPMRHDLFSFVVWDTLERQLKAAGGQSGTFRFDLTRDGDNDDFHMIGDALAYHRREAIDKPTEDAFFSWWTRNIKGAVYVRWPKQAIELQKLFSWCENTYLYSEVLKDPRLKAPNEPTNTP